MKEFTYGELKQGLLCCTVYRDCTGCPFYVGSDTEAAKAGDLSCTRMLLSTAMNCINVMEKDLEEAVLRANSWEVACEHLEAEIHALHEAQDERCIQQQSLNLWVDQTCYMVQIAGTLQHFMWRFLMLQRIDIKLTEYWFGYDECYVFYDNEHMTQEQAEKALEFIDWERWEPELTPYYLIIPAVKKPLLNSIKEYFVSGRHQEENS